MHTSYFFSVYWVRMLYLRTYLHSFSTDKRKKIGVRKKHTLFFILNLKNCSHVSGRAVAGEQSVLVGLRPRGVSRRRWRRSGGLVSKSTRWRRCHGGPPPPPPATGVVVVDDDYDDRTTVSKLSSAARTRRP